LISSAPVKLIDMCVEKRGVDRGAYGGYGGVLGYVSARVAIALGTFLVVTMKNMVLSMTLK
jgi:hypothetical protein